MSRIPIACTLTASEQVDRADEWRHLKMKATTRELTDEGARLIFEHGTATAAELADLAERETACCQFFNFTVEITAQHLVLNIAAPDDARPIVAALVE